MVARGRVQNGVVVMDHGVRLPEGQEVTVLAGETALATSPMQGAPSHSLLDIQPLSLGPVLRTVTTGGGLLGEMLEGRS